MEENKEKIAYLLGSVVKSHYQQEANEKHFNPILIYMETNIQI